MTDERTKFEAWWHKDRKPVKNDPDIEFAWYAWQARAVLASQQKPVAGLDEVALRVAKEEWSKAGRTSCDTWWEEVHPIFCAIAHRLVAELKGQEPVAWELRKGKTDRVLIGITNNSYMSHSWKCSLEEVVPLYAAPIPAVPTGWVGCGECDCEFPCHEGEARCIRLAAAPEVKP